MKTFPGISSRAFEHPADRAALTALRQVRGFDLVLQKIMGLIGEKRLRLIFLGSALRVSEAQKPATHKLFLEVCAQFDLTEIPELFISYSPALNAAAIGVDNPFIVLHSALVERLDERELRFVLAHEIGHIISGHSLYRTLLLVLLKIVDRFLGIPRLILLPVLLGLLEWSRKSELTADRAGLLSVDDLAVAQSVIMKLCGATNVEEFDIAEFEKQADEYEAAGDVLDNVYKILNLAFASHPLPVVRLKEIRKFYESKDYQDIQAGNYTKRGTSDLSYVKEDIDKARQDYAEVLTKAKDTFSDSLSEFVGVMESRGSNAINALFPGKKRKS